jgi:hypothetical protein
MMATFAAQFAISSSTLGFCMYMLWRGNDPGVYLPIVTGILGYWLPSPRMAETRETVPDAPPADLEQPLLHSSRVAACSGAF